MAAIGVGATLIVALIVIVTLLQSGGQRAVSQNAAVIGALVALGGVFTTQLVNSALENQRAQEAALQKYFEKIGDLTVDPDHPLGHSTPGDNLSTVVRAQTQTVLAGLDDPARKRILLQFLIESGLIDKAKPIISLSGANLTGVVLRGANLSKTNLVQADLREADLSKANLSKANLTSADLRGADLSGADLRGAYLYETNLFHALLPGADLREADVRYADLRGAYLRKADLREASLTRTDLREANLEAANLRNARLLRTDLSGAYLALVRYGKPSKKRADLRGAYLVEAVLKDAKGFTQKQLARRAKSLEGTIMPDGSKHH